MAVVTMAVTTATATAAVVTRDPSTRGESPLLREFLDRDPEFLPEFWALFTLGMVIIILRFPVQIRRVGVKGLMMDDYVAVITLAAWISTMMMVQQVYQYGTNVDVSQYEVDQLSQSDINSLIYGSKCQQAAWYCYVSLLWSMKLTILLLYKRLIGHLWHQNVFRAVAIFATMSYTAVILTITLSCRPFPANYQVQPLPSFECTFKLKNLLVTTTLNITTDIVILFLAVPLLKELNVPLLKKFFVMILLCSGVFVIAAAIMRVVLTLQGVPSTETINRWGVRECLVGVAAINAPALRPLFTRSFWRGSPKAAPPVAPPRKRRAAHSRAHHLARQGFRKDSVVGWWQSNMSVTLGTTRASFAGGTWRTSESTVVDRSGGGTLTTTTTRNTTNGGEGGGGSSRRWADYTGRAGLGTMMGSTAGGGGDEGSEVMPIRPVYTRESQGRAGSDAIDIELGYIDEDDGVKEGSSRAAVYRMPTATSPP